MSHARGDELGHLRNHDAAHRVANDDPARDAGLDHRLGHGPRVRIDGRTAALVGAAAVSRQVDGDRSMPVLLQAAHQSVPRPRAMTHPVHQHELFRHAERASSRG